MKVLRFLLFPFAVLYDMVTSIRNFLFYSGFLKSALFKTPTIAVGNLSVGGTGKTPQIEYLIRLLNDTYRVAILSRGYKRKTTGFVLVNSGHSFEDAGDEPMQYFKKFKEVSVAVDANRVNGIKQLLVQKSPEVVLLDDAFQHRKVKASFYLLLTKYDELYTDDFLLPTGNLRESKRGAKRADVILVTKCPLNLSEIAQQEIVLKINPRPYQQVFFTCISYVDTLKGSMQVTVDELVDYAVVLVTGIANPMPLLDFLGDKNVHFEHLFFPDHHHFSKKDIDKIKSKYLQIDSVKKIILTTEKDFVRLSEKIKNLSYLEIETVFLSDQKRLFDKEILGLLK
jgi:tetraacyldisaccharide 4'-kinase